MGPKVQVSGECLLLRFNTYPFSMSPKELKGVRAGDGRHEKKKGKRGKRGQVYIGKKKHPEEDKQKLN